MNDTMSKKNENIDALLKKVDTLLGTIKERKAQRNSNNVARSGRDMLPPGQMSAPRAGGKLATQLANICPDLPEYSKGWLVNHLDPCGEYKTQLDYGKVPDGAVPMSACGELRQVLTVRRPGLEVNEVPLDGGMWSLALLHLPLFRTPLLIVASLDRAEVQKSDLDLVLADWNNRTDFTPAQHPNWESVGAGVYYQIVQWTALQGLLPPTALGVSDTVSEYRITSDGMTFFFNAPTLINQGIVVGAQFNADVEVQDNEPEIGGGLAATTLFLALSGGGTDPNQPFTLSYKLPGVGSGSVEVGGDIPNGTIVFSGTATGSFTNSTTPGRSWAAGDLVGIRKTATAINPTDTAFDVLVEGAAAGGNILLRRPNSSFVNYGATDEVPEDEFKVNAAVFPPITQEELTQATPKTVQFLLQESRGAYMVKRLFQPVMSMTKAVTYGPVKWKTSNTSVNQFFGSTGGLPDSFDSNYGIGVMNISSLPNAAQPYLKLRRYFEAIPASSSSWGPFASSTTPKDELALELARAVHDEDPFMYPENYNGFGLLFKKVFTVVKKLPLYMRNTATVVKAVGDCVEEVNAAANKVGMVIQGQRAVAL